MAIISILTEVVKCDRRGKHFEGVEITAIVPSHRIDLPVDDAQCETAASSKAGAAECALSVASDIIP